MTMEFVWAELFQSGGKLPDVVRLKEMYPSHLRRNRMFNTTA